jgi:hypothetical protein
MGAGRVDLALGAKGGQVAAQLSGQLTRTQST